MRNGKVGEPLDDVQKQSSNFKISKFLGKLILLATNDLVELVNAYKQRTYNEDITCLTKNFGGKSWPF